MKFLEPANGAPRLSVTEYRQLCCAHFRRYWKSYTIPVVVVLLLQLVLRIDVNYTESLPGHVFITIKGWKTDLQRGEYVAYAFPTEHPYSPFRKGAQMVKIIGGVPGDVVRMTENRGFEVIGRNDSDAFGKIGGHFMGTAKPISRMGKPLEAGPVGVIPKGEYYVFAPHKDSLDSRYAMVGWVRAIDIVGRTYAIF